MPIFDVRHQARAHCILQRAMRSKRVPHAYVFHGPDGVGKRMLAVRFARLLLCVRPTHVAAPPELAQDKAVAWRDACGECEACRLTAAETHPDMQVVYKELNRYHPAPEVRARKALDLGVDVVRHFIIDRVADRPSHGHARVFIVVDADQMSISAQNALLKTLEEPPSAAFIILVVRSLDRLLPTTLSRCQPVPFVALPDAFVEEQLRAGRPALPHDHLRFLSRYCNGQLGVAIRQVKGSLFENKIVINRALADLPQSGPSPFVRSVQDCASSLADDYVAEMIQSGLIDKASETSGAEPTRRGFLESLNLAAGFYRDVMQIGCGRSDVVVNTDQMALLNATAERLPPEVAASAIREIHRTESDIVNNANVVLALEALAIRLTRLEGLPSDHGHLRSRKKDA